MEPSFHGDSSVGLQFSAFYTTFGFTGASYRTPTPCFLKILFNIIVSSTTDSLSWRLLCTKFILFKCPFGVTVFTACHRAACSLGCPTLSCRGYKCFELLLSFVLRLFSWRTSAKAVDLYRKTRSILPFRNIHRMEASYFSVRASLIASVHGGSIRNWSSKFTVASLQLMKCIE